MYLFNFLIFFYPLKLVVWNQKVGWVFFEIMIV